MVVLLDLLLVEQLNFFLLLVESHHLFLQNLLLGMFVFNVFFISLQIINLSNELLVLTHDPFVVCFMEFDVLFELFLEPFDSGLKMCSLFDELFLLVNPFHLLLALLFYILPVDFYDFGLQSFIILHRCTITVM